jgi:hypothetical protein
MANNFLADDEYFPDIVARQEELDGGEVTKEILNVAIIENALQSEVAPHAGAPASCRGGDDGVHFQSLVIDDVVTMAGGIGTSVARVKEGQQHSPRLH